MNNVKRIEQILNIYPDIFSSHSHINTLKTLKLTVQNNSNNTPKTFCLTILIKNIGKFVTSV